MTKSHEKIPELQKVNLCCINCYIMLVLMLITFSIVQVLLTDTSVTRFFPLYIVMGITGVASLIIFNLYKNSPMIKHIVACSCGLSYAVLLFTNDTAFAFTYAIPMLIVTTAFGDFIFSCIIDGGVILINIAVCVVNVATKQLTNDDIFSMVLRLTFVLFVTVDVVFVTRLIVQLNNEKAERMNAEKDKVSELLSHILSVSNDMIDDISDVSENMKLFRESVTETQSAMEEVSKGTNETAESVQVQLIKTEEIQNQIENVTDASKNIESDVTIARESIVSGETNINELIHQVEISETASTTVAKELTELDQSTEKMHSIIEVINNIASQTSLLSLNASIEAARAGEAGRGFAVVASEISNLASQTQDATSNISNLIGNVSDVVANVIESINHLIASNNEQASAATKSAKSFAEINARTKDIYERSNDLIKSVNALASSNHEIIESISTISAVTEEVSAHSNATYSASEKNSEAMTTLSNIIASLSDKAKILQNNEE